MLESATIHLGRTKVNNFSSIDIPVLEKFCVGKRVLQIFANMYMNIIQIII